MNILYLIGALLLLIILGYPYFLLVISNRETGATRAIGRIISGLFVAVLLLLIVLYQAGIVQAPSVRFMPERPSTRMIRGASGYVVGMMSDDERVVDEFIRALKADPELYKKFKERIK